MPITLLRQLPSLSHIRFTADRTQVACDPPSESATGLGTLYIDEQRLVFFSTEASRGFSIDYPTIVIHAVSRNSDKADAHLYCQLDDTFPDSGKSDGNDEEDDDEQFAELRFVPEDKKLLDDVFKAMSDCAALNPDDSGSESETDGDDICKGDYHDGTASVDEDNGDDDDESAVQTIDGFDSSAFITTADQLEGLTAKGKEILARLESVIIEPMEEPNGSNDDGRYADAE